MYWHTLLTSHTNTLLTSHVWVKLTPEAMDDKIMQNGEVIN